MLSDSDKADCRRFLGFPMFGAVLTPGFGYRYTNQYLLVEYRFNNMSPEEESLVTTLYLPNLRQLETDIFNVRDNSDTSKAAVWERNSLELSERVRNFNYWRKRFADFFGVQPIYPAGSNIQMVV